MAAARDRAGSAGRVLTVLSALIGVREYDVTPRNIMRRFRCPRCKPVFHGRQEEMHGVEIPVSE
jgi:hypothetical protein